MEYLKGKRILLGVTGGIAAYKCCELIRLLRKAGAGVRVVMTPAAEQFITPLTLATLSGAEVLRELFPSGGSVDHISSVREADLLILAPATANTLAKMAGGIADNLLTCCLLAARIPVLAAPAMNCAMYENPATAANICTLRERGVHFVGPDVGWQACGESGPGRMSAPEAIFREAADLLLRPGQIRGTMVITAGPTEEPLDPVRTLTNRSSGRMGYALAGAAAMLGWRVRLISGPVTLDPPPAVDLIPVRTAAEMMDAAWREAKEADCFVGCAAVADFRPDHAARNKIKKCGEESLKLTLVPNPDIIRTIAGLDTVLAVGFAAETEHLAEYARHKLATKDLDLIVANDVSSTETGFGSEDNAALMIFRDGREVSLPRMRKEDMALRIISEINDLLDRQSRESAPV